MTKHKYNIIATTTARALSNNGANIQTVAVCVVCGCVKVVVREKGLFKITYTKGDLTQATAPECIGSRVIKHKLGVAKKESVVQPPKIQNVYSMLVSYENTWDLGEKLKYLFGLNLRVSDIECLYLKYNQTSKLKGTRSEKLVKLAEVWNNNK